LLGLASELISRHVFQNGSSGKFITAVVLCLVKQRDEVKLASRDYGAQTNARSVWRYIKI